MHRIHGGHAVEHASDISADRRGHTVLSLVSKGSDMRREDYVWQCLQLSDLRRFLAADIERRPAQPSIFERLQQRRF